MIYKYKCNNSGCPHFVRTGQPLPTNEVDPCPMCGHPVVSMETEEVVKTRVVEYKGNKLYYENTEEENDVETDRNTETEMG